MKSDVIEYLVNCYNDSEMNSIMESIKSAIEDLLKSSGLMYRLFCRVKTKDSICKKIDKKYDKYVKDNSKLQDVLGIRIVLYFRDDIDICINMLKSIFEENSHEFDEVDTYTFKPLRINYVFNIPKNVGFIPKSHGIYGMIDNTFEVQLRTIFTEGWQEVEHDVRYKYQEDWNDVVEMSRDLNAISAVLEMCDNNLIGICDNMSYIKYKNREIESMIRNRFRIRVSSEKINNDLEHIILSDYQNIGKEIFRFERNTLILVFSKYKIERTLNNIVFIANKMAIHNSKIDELDRVTSIIPDDTFEIKTGSKKNEPHNSIIAMRFQ